MSVFLFQKHQRQRSLLLRSGLQKMLKLINTCIREHADIKSKLNFTSQENGVFLC